MGYSWSRMKHYSQTGWRHCSTRLFVLMTTLVFVVSLAGSAPFWVTFSTLMPFLLIYFPLLGFCLEIMERDWEDWHLW